MLGGYSSPMTDETAEPEAVPPTHWATDCDACLGLCCVAFAHNREAGFPAFKPLNTPCRHLAADFRCGVFDTLEKEGFKVCRAYDCFGAGPAVTDRMRSEREGWTREDVARATDHLDGFRELARLRMLIVALEVEGGDEAAMVVAHLTNIAEEFRSTGEVRVDAETSIMLRSQERLISAMLAPMDRTDGGEGSQ